MTIFVIVTAVLLCTAVVLVAYPLFRDRESLAVNSEDAVVGLSRERLQDLKRQRDANDISDSEYAERVRDLEAQLSDDLRTQGSQDSAGGRGARWVGIAAVVFIPVLSGLLYLSLGRPQALDPAARVAAEAPSPGEISPADIDAMVARLAQRLENDPDDAEGWFMLGRSLMVLKRYGEAAEAFQSLRKVVGDEPDVLLRQATALALEQGGGLAGEPVRLVRQVLEQQPEAPRALWMAATAAYQAGDIETALDYYRRVEPKLDGEAQRNVQGMIEQLSRQANKP